MSASPASVRLDEPQRQSPLAVLFLALRTVRQVGLIQIGIGVGFVLAQSPSFLVLFVITAVAGAVVLGIGALQWWRYTFAVIDDELRVERGVISHQRLSIPLERVQSVSTEQRLLHRPVSLVQVSIETAGAEGAELTIDAVSRDVVDELQRVAADHRSIVATRVSQRSAPSSTPQVDMPPPPQPPEVVLLRHSPSRMVKIALTQMPLSGLVLLAPLFAVGEDLRSVIPFDIPEIDEPTGWGWLLWAIPALVFSVVLISVVLNIARVLFTDWDLTVTSTPAGLRRDAGLLSRTSVASSLPRVQWIGTRQRPIERLASLQSVKLDTIGSANLSIPGCDEDQVVALRGLALDGSPGVSTLDRRVSQKEVFLNTRNTAIVVSVAVAVLFIFIRWWSLPLLAMVPVVWLATRRSVRLRRWGFSADAVADRREFLGSTNQELLLRKVNSVTVRQSLFERKRGLATILIGTAVGGISIGMLPLAEARATRDHVLHAVETDRRSWM